MTANNSIWEKRVSHGEILKLIWKNLDLGTLDRNHPFHLPAIATVENGMPRARTVVLRRFWRKPASLAFHAHAGSPKVGQLRENPNISWLFYHPAERLQVRISGLAEVLTDGDLHDEQWQATDLFSRRCYIGDSPSQLSDKPTSGLPDEFLSRKPSRDQSEAGRSSFVVVRSSIDEIDCMELDVKGHRRSWFRWNTDGGLETKWLTP